MPILNLDGRITSGIAGGINVHVDGNIGFWPKTGETPEVVPFAAYYGQPIFGGGQNWVDDRTIIFQWCGEDEDNPNDTGPSPGLRSGLCYLYVYDIITKQTLRVKDSGANFINGGAGRWSAQLNLKDPGITTNLATYNNGVYANTQTSIISEDGSAGWLVAQIDKSTGIALVNIGYQGKGIGYFLPSQTDSDDEPTIITYDQLDAFGLTIGNGVVFYRSGGVLHRYVIPEAEELLDNPDSPESRESFSNLSPGVSNLPILYGRNFGEWLVGFHTPTGALVVHKFGSAMGWKITEDNDNSAFNADICVARDGRLIVTASTTQGERPQDIRRWVIDRNSPQIYLYEPSEGAPAPNPYAPDTRGTTPVIGTDIITRDGGTHTQLIKSDDWFPERGGNYIRGAWQYGTTAVIAQLGSSNVNDNSVFVKDSQGRTWSGGEIAHGIHCVAIRPDSSSTQQDIRWEVTWVQLGGAAYRRAILENANSTALQVVGSITTDPASFGSQGMLDIDPDTGVPIITDDNRYGTYGYVQIGLPTTRGTWTIGQDLQTPVARLIAWDDDTKRAYVVWNGYTPVQSRLALEDDGNGNITPVVAPALQPFTIRFEQFLPLGQIDYETGATPGVSFDLTKVSPVGAIVSDTTVTGGGLRVTVGAQQQAVQAAAKAALSKNTRVFRAPKSVIPSATILSAAAGAAAVAGAVAGLFGSGAGTMDEDPPVDIPECAMPGDVTVVTETPGGHAVFAVDTPGHEKLHMQHASGTHIEMRPDGGMKTKVLQRRHDITIGDHDIYVAGDCSIVTDNGYHVRTDKGDIIIDGGGGKIKIHGDSDGKLTIQADDIEFKADKSIFLNAPQVDIGSVRPSNKPILSIPGKMDLYPFPCPTCPPPRAFVPLYNILPTPALIASLSSKATSMVGAATSAANKAAMLKGLSDSSGLPAFSELDQQPEEYALSSSSIYTATDTPERRKFRDRLFDTPEDVGDTESYSAHISLCVEKGDFKDTDKKLPGQLFESDDTEPPVEPAPFLAFPLASGGVVSCITGNTTIIGTNTTFTEDLLVGHDIVINNVRGHITAIHDDTRLELDAPWAGQNIQSGEIKVYRIRPFKEYFGKFEYPSSSPLGRSGLKLSDMMKNFHSPVIEVPQNVPTSLTPGKEPEPCGAPAVIPNVFATVKQVFESRDDWNLDKLAKSPNGEAYHPDFLKYQGLFIEAVVRALGPEWGFRRKTTPSGYNIGNYNGHDYQCIVYKSPTPLYNGKTYQIVDILLEAPGPLSKIQWYPVCAPTNEDIWYREG